MTKPVDVAIQLFNEYDKTHEFASGTNGPRLNWTMNKSEHIENKNKSLDFPYKKELCVDNNIKMMTHIYENYDAIQLRDLNGEHKLIVGCGNTPINAGGFTKKIYQKKGKDYKDHNKFWIKYRKEHKHKKCYTIDPNIGMNPSIVGEFGIIDITFLPREIFEEIEFEGFMIHAFQDKDIIYTRNINTISSILYLLKDDGIVSLSHDSISKNIFKKVNGKLEYIKDPNIKLNSQNGILPANDDVQSYYKFYELMD